VPYPLAHVRGIYTFADTGATQEMRKCQTIMTNDQTPAEQPVVPASASQLLTVSMVMPTMGDSATQGASFAGLLLGLAALALERFGAARERQCQAATEESLPSCLAGAPADPFDGQFLRFRNEDNGLQFYSIDASPPPRKKF
jgi:hypothetical protein